MLVYNSRKVNPKTFDPEDKDLRKLVGHCFCGRIIRGNEAIPHADPFESEIHQNNTPIVQCKTCDYESNRET